MGATKSDAVSEGIFEARVDGAGDVDVAGEAIGAKEDEDPIVEYFWLGIDVDGGGVRMLPRTIVECDDV